MKNLIPKRVIIAILLINTIVINVNGQTIHWDTETVAQGLITREIKPNDYQLYPRNEQDEALVELSGELVGHVELVEGIALKVTKTDFYGNESEIFAQIKWFSVNDYKFNFLVNIVAELSDYKFEYALVFRYNDPEWIKIAEKVVCGDAFLIAGQSNASAVLSFADDDGYNELYGGTGEDPFGRYSRSYGRLFRGYIECGELLSEWGLANVLRDDDYLTPDCCDFHVGAWGLYLQYRIQQEYGIPTCIINGAMGSTSLISNLPDEDNFDLSTYFGNYNYRIHQAGVESSIKGILWYQGENEGGFVLGYEEFQELYAGWMTNFDNPYPKVYICQLSPPQSPTNYGNIMEELRRLPSIFPDTEVMSTNGVEHRAGIHFQPKGYSNIGERLFRLLERDWYCKVEEIDNITPPQIQRVYYEDDRCVIEFDQILDADSSDDPYNVWNCINLNIIASSKIVPDPNPKIEGNKFTFVVDNFNATHISYLDEIPDYDFKGYLRNKNEVGALAFYNVPITAKESQPNKNSLTYGENYSRNGPLINDEYASGRLSGNVDNDVSAFDIFNVHGQSTVVSTSAIVNLKSAHSIIFNPGFKAPKYSYLKAEVSLDLFAFTPNNYCTVPSKNLYNENSSADEGFLFINSSDNNNTVDLIVYPNPNCGLFKIRMAGSITDAQVSVYNMSGLLLKQLVLDDNCLSNGCLINLGEVNKGIYLLRIKTCDKLIQKQIVVL